MKQPVNGFASPSIARMFDPQKENNEGFISQPTEAKSPSKTGPIIGGVMGGVAAIIAVTTLAIWLVRRRSEKRVHEELPAPDMDKSEKILYAPYSMEHQSPVVELPAELPVAELSGKQGPYELGEHSKSIKI